MLTFDDLDTELVIGVGSKVKQLDGELRAVDEALFAGEFRVVAYDVVAGVVNARRTSQRRVGPRQLGTRRRQHHRLDSYRRHHRCHWLRS